MKKLKILRTSTSEGISKAFAQMRERRKWTQRQLADRLGLQHSIIAMIETDQRALKLAEFIIWAEELDEDPIKLLKEILRERS